MLKYFPDMIVEADWLETRLDEPDLRIIDCHYDITHEKSGSVSFRSGLEDWEKASVPGSVYIDILKDLSDRTSEIPVMLPPPDQFAEVMEKQGIGNDTAVVVYDRGESTWAARLWFMFKVFGFKNVALLNGGWTQWRDGGHPVDRLTKSVSPTRFQTDMARHLVVDKAAVLNSLDSSIKRICALGKEGYDAGHIPKSLNIPARDFVHPDRKTFLSKKEIKTIFEQHGISPSDSIITYCGGGIAASLCQFALAYTGHDNARMYDASLEEWRRDADCPLEVTAN